MITSLIRGEPMVKPLKFCTTRSWQIFEIMPGAPSNTYSPGKEEVKMAKMSKYMVTHINPDVSWEKVEENWAKLANVETASWMRTCYNKEKGIRYCVWLAPNEDTLQSIFSELDISWDSIVAVEETVPDLWGKKWEEHLEAEASASTLGF